MANTPILSICIPTYNRADILNKSLYILTSNEAFDDQTEVVIVDIVLRIILHLLFNFTIINTKILFLTETQKI